MALFTTFSFEGVVEKIIIYTLSAMSFPPTRE